jgi:hypothetical protein
MEVFQVVLGGVVAAIVSASVTLWNQSRERRQRSELVQRDLEHQTREALRHTYAQLLVVQRKSREASVQLAAAGGAPGNGNLADPAIAAHAEFIDLYHQLNLDSSPEMWFEARGLRDILDKMLEFAQAGQADECRSLVKVARSARQNLERSFRERLGYVAHQSRRPLGEYDKIERR